LKLSLPEVIRQIEALLEAIVLQKGGVIWKDDSGAQHEIEVRIEDDAS
jgi:hypothetical protein